MAARKTFDLQKVRDKSLILPARRKKSVFAKNTEIRMINQWCKCLAVALRVVKANATTGAAAYIIILVNTTDTHLYYTHCWPNETGQIQSLVHVPFLENLNAREVELGERHGRRQHRNALQKIGILFDNVT